MRIVFLFFLLINTAYYYFQSEQFQGPAPTVLIKQPAMPLGAEKLVLLRERGLSSPLLGGAGIAAQATQAPQTAAETEPKPKVAQQQTAILENGSPVSATKKSLPKPAKSKVIACFTLGPFGEAAQASQASEAIGVLGVEISRRQGTHRTPKGYWVYLPPSASYKSAQRKVKEMRKKGLQDLFIMGKGANKNAISLGLFKNKSAAEERFHRVKGMGLKAKMETQYRVKKEVWLDMSVPGDQTTTVADVAEIGEIFPKADLTQRKCD